MPGSLDSDGEEQVFPSVARGMCFGPPAFLMTDTPSMRTSRFWSVAGQMAQDARRTFRMLRKSPVFAAVALVTMAVGIGANTAIFSVVNAVVLRPLGYPQPDRLMFLTTRIQGFDEFWVSSPEYFELTEISRSYSSIGAFRTGEANLSAADRPWRVKTADVNVDLLETLRPGSTASGAREA